MLTSSDMIYISEGDTSSMLEIWKKYGFDALLKEEWEKGKLICGTSAGAVCWFNSFTTSDEEKHRKTLEGLSFVDAYMTVHGQEDGMYAFTKQAIENTDKLGILLTNGSAIEIIDEKCRIITSNDNIASYPFYGNNEGSYAILSYFQNGKYYERKIMITTKSEKLDKTLVLKR